MQLKSICGRITTTDNNKRTLTGFTGVAWQITHIASSSAPSTVLPNSRTARATRSRFALRALAATVAVHTGPCALAWRASQSWSQ